MGQCGINWLDEFVRRRGVVDYMYLAILTSECHSENTTYIVILIKKQKGKPCQIGLPLLKNDITNILDTGYLHFHSRYSKYG